jgi:hypothetical protein
MGMKPSNNIIAMLLILIAGIVVLAACSGSPTGDPGAGQPTAAAATQETTPRSTSTPTATITPTATEVLPTPSPALAIDEESVFFACLTKRADDFGPAGPWELLDKAVVARPTEGFIELPGSSYHVCAYALAANQPASLALDMAVLSKSFADVPFHSSKLGQYYYFALIDENIPYRYAILNAQDVNVIELTVLGPGDQILRQDRLRILGKPPKPTPTPK